tara:strand:+ start:179 stop:442 length:264 start_codon:yes stop_codon:yes gene_type:complete
MFLRIKNFFYILSVLIFTFFVTKYYFSDVNKKKINKSRIFYSDHLSSNLTNLPILENDTKDIIEYNEIIDQSNQKKSKRKFWKLIFD